jgi:hypothetical protein
MGHIRFVGELFMESMISASVIMSCMGELLELSEVRID